MQGSSIREVHWDLNSLTGLESESMDYIVKQLEKTDYADVVIRGAQRLFSDNSFSSFERNRDLYFLDYFDSYKIQRLQPGKDIPFFPEEEDRAYKYKYHLYGDQV